MNPCLPVYLPEAWQVGVKSVAVCDFAFGFLPAEASAQAGRI
jgi:hypothetical protein